MGPKTPDSRECREPGLFSSSSQDRVDCRRRFAVVLLEPVGINPQGDVGLGVPEPSADGDDIDALVDQLTGMGMAQHMECEFWHADPLSEFTPCPAEPGRRNWRTVNVPE